VSGPTQSLWPVSGTLNGSGRQRRDQTTLPRCQTHRSRWSVHQAATLQHGTEASGRTGDHLAPHPVHHRPRIGCRYLHQAKRMPKNRCGELVRIQPVDHLRQRTELRPAVTQGDVFRQVRRDIGVERPRSRLREAQQRIGDTVGAENTETARSPPHSTGCAPAPTLHHRTPVRTPRGNAISERARTDHSISSHPQAALRRPEKRPVRPLRTRSPRWPPTRVSAGRMA
jgi:hypothetical protein